MAQRPRSEPVDRLEFEGYIRRHEADHFAHAPMRHDFRSEIVGEGLQVEGRLAALERWQQRIIGGLMFGALLLGSGAVLAVVELFRR